MTADAAAAARCSSTSAALGEDLAGTASTVDAFVLLEHGGPWGVSALRDAPFPDGLAAVVRRRCEAAGARPLLIRRHRARPGPPRRPRVVLAVVSPVGGRAVLRTLGDVRQAAAVDLPPLLAALRDGRTPDGWREVDRLLLTCTHGRHDRCCAERGRPVAEAMQDVAGDDAWEVSHIGGDRFAGNVLALPEALYYGRVPPERAAEVAAAHDQGRCVLDLLRGRAGLPFPVQAAEIALRRYLGVDALDAVRPLSTARRDRRTSTTWRVGGHGTWRVLVDTTHPGPLRPLTCGTDAAAPPLHTVVEITDVRGPGRGAEGWDEAHAAAALAEPSASVVLAVSALRPGRALDVGAGTGRHALWLARSGWRVTGLDYSRVGLAVGRGVADDEGLAVDWVCADARVWQPPTDDAGYDLVLLAFVQLPEVVRRAASWLAPGGRLVVVGHSERNLGEGVGGPSDPRLLHDPGSLLRDAAGLEVERLEEVLRPTPEGDAVDVVLVARRPPP